MDPYVYPHSKVLKNKLGITDYDSWKEIEGLLAASRILELRQKTPAFRRFDFEALKAMHRYIFQDMYAWAGSPRTIAIAKGNTMFCLPQNVDSFAQEIFGRLANLAALQQATRPELVAFLGDLFCDINMLHPFREGNGRTQREYMFYLAKALGYQLDLALADASLYQAASLQSPVSSELAHRLIEENLR